MHERDFTEIVRRTVVTGAAAASRTPLEDAEAYGQAVANAITHLTTLQVERQCAHICQLAVGVGSESWAHAEALRGRFQKEINHFGTVLGALFDEATCAHITVEAEQRAGALLAPIDAITGQGR